MNLFMESLRTRSLFECVLAAGAFEFLAESSDSKTFSISITFWLRLNKISSHSFSPKSSLACTYLDTPFSSTQSGVYVKSPFHNILSTTSSWSCFFDIHCNFLTPNAFATD
ncbi:hypothetical protein M758_6G089000 [Ceratodon purpureus]|nr:hypothetical protein M758_6G089000 [Ceratodon purpureus]